MALTSLTATALLISVCTLQAAANIVLEWNGAMMGAIRSDNSGPTLSTRNLAILHLAIYESFNGVQPGHQPYQFVVAPPPDTSSEAAAAAAGYEVMKTLYPALRARADETFAAWLTSTPPSDALGRGLEFGASIARLILESRANDGASTEVPYIPSDAPGQWRRTPPAFRPPLTPQWRYVQPFALPATSAFVPAPPPPLDSPAYAAAFNEVKRLGARLSAERTAEQTAIAIFWSDFSYTAMPPGHWHEIAAGIARARELSLPDTARLMALLSLAQADTAIVCWEAKYRHNTWRPITAIQRAAEDGNPATEPDPQWDSLLAAPPFPGYISGHSAFSAASAEVLTAFFGTDAIPFTAASDSLPGVFRSYTSLAKCAEEVGQSRIYGGIHFQFDNVEGKASGRKIARHVVENHLLANAALPTLRIEGFDAAALRIRAHGHIGAPLRIERSADLTHWTWVADAAGRPGGVLVTQPVSESPMGFYRVIETPVPANPP